MSTILEKLAAKARPASAPVARELDIFVNVRGPRLQLVLQAPSTDPLTGEATRERKQFASVQTWPKASPAEMNKSARELRDKFRANPALVEKSMDLGWWELERERAPAAGKGSVLNLGDL